MSTMHRTHGQTTTVTQPLGALEACAARGLRITEPRKRVFEIICASATAIKAYDVLRRMSTGNRRVKPPTVYRALDFLLTNGLIHRVESENAFVVCDHPHQHHAWQLLICDRCGGVTELHQPDVDRLLGAAAAAHRFDVTRRSIELRGTCVACQEVGEVRRGARTARSRPV